MRALTTFATETFGRIVVALLPFLPRILVARVARRYVAGASLDDALRVTRELATTGATATIDVLGEEVRDAARANAETDTYLAVLEAIAREKLRATVSLKPSMLGLRIDEALCRANIERVFTRAAQLNIGVCLDMEDSTTTDATIALFAAMHARFKNAGIAFQACLRRSANDVATLETAAHIASTPASIRLCKGIYVEPETIAFRDPEDVRDSYRRLLDTLMAGPNFCAIATHDRALVATAETLLAKHHLPKTRYEFQMLLGVEPTLRAELLAKGHPLRVYIPFGHDWYAYSLRRLRENPQIAWHVLRALFSPT